MGLAIVRTSRGAGAAGVVSPGGALDVAEKDAQDGDGGCDDSDARLGVAPDEEVDAVI